MREASKPEWARVISNLRDALQLSQTNFGERLRCSAMSVSRWERGVLEPSAGQYLHLGNLAPDPLCWYLWGRAGLRSSDVMRVLPAFRRRLRENRLTGMAMVTAGSGPRKPAEKSQLIAIPLLKVVAGAHGHKGDDILDFEQQVPDSMIAAPKEWCPHPEHTLCLRVKGDSMTPLLHDGYIVAVDASQTSREDLYGKIVVMWHKKNGLTISRLVRYDHTEVLVPENRDYQALTLQGDHDWRIMAKVLWWVGKAP